MEQRKRWHFWLIIAVMALTVYNILPTVFFYARDLDQPVGKASAEKVAQQIVERVNGLEHQAVDWIGAYAKNLGVKVKSVALREDDPRLVDVDLADSAAAEKFKKYLPRAGALIPFAPAQLQLVGSEENRVTVGRMVASHLGKEDFIFDEIGSDLHRELILDRAKSVAQAIGGESQAARMIGADLPGESLLGLAQRIVEFERDFGLDSPITKRYFASFTQAKNSSGLIQSLTTQLERLRGRLEGRQKETVEAALAIVRGNQRLFEAGETPLTIPAEFTSIDFGMRNPFIASLAIEDETLQLTLHSDLIGNEKVHPFIVNEIAQISRESGEMIRPDGNHYAVALDTLAGSQSFLGLDLAKVANQRLGSVEDRLRHLEMTSSDLSAQNYPVMSWSEFQKRSGDQRALGLVLYAPVADQGEAPAGFKKSSIYVIARGMGQLLERSNDALRADQGKLAEVLAQDNFLAYSGTSYGVDSAFKNDIIFELEDYYSDLLMATRENFQVHGSKSFAILDFTDEKQRLLTTNEIETKEHEDLLKWSDAYQAAQVNRELDARYDVPAPTKSLFWDNLRLSARKYFRGDDRKILKWGLDLSGGKSVSVGLVGANGQTVKNEADIRQGINELQQRVNKLGVSEVEIRQEGDHIAMNFPGAQGLSAAELVKASKMSFHIVNEQFGRRNPELGASVSPFLHEVWNEAVVTGRKEIEALNEIALQRLDPEGPRTEAAVTLYDAGLRIADSLYTPSSDFNDSLSSIAIFRGDDFSEWQGNTNPLSVVFANYALEGTNLDRVRGDYDTSKGNILVFSVKSSADADGYRLNPQEELFNWTSQFAESKIAGTPKAKWTNGRGWRMAVILNDQIVSAPGLKDALRSNGEVSGSFSQREVNDLVADLKAGSLSFTPKILSEKNVSPDLGQAERIQGISAAIIGLALVFLMMAWYYRFAGMVAGFALFFNLVIMWGVLQNLDAALTLPGIAGIILTIGMAVDANVLVFERVREEFGVSGRIASAVHAGYRKAFSAILDSNVTTVIAAFILLHFDAGPIKGFALTLIIGIVSSMFTALFMTRYFFSGWVQNPKHTELKMRNLFKSTNFDFLKRAKGLITVALLIIVAGMALTWMQRQNIFGMDFTGGYALNLSVEGEGNVRERALESLVNAGAPSTAVQVRELNRPDQLRIQLDRGLDEAGQPFAGMGEAFSGENPRIDWVVDALQAGGLTIVTTDLASHWNVISGQFSDSMRNSAIWGLGLALLAILIYITIRFEFKYAISSITALAHDLLITVGMMSILRYFGVPLVIDLQVIGALMTIVGYSLNDTIVIFDRIREESRLNRKVAFKQLVNGALNSTLNRTLITSGTTLLVLLALDFFGGMAIFNFALVMTMGVVFGTFSSLFIASPVLLYFHNREVRIEESEGSNRRSA